MPKTILIDASSQLGGGVSLLQSLLSNPSNDYHFIVVLSKKNASLFQGNEHITTVIKNVGSTFSVRRFLWLFFCLFIEYRKYRADLLFVMTPLYFGPRVQLYTLIQNALPFSNEKQN